MARRGATKRHARQLRHEGKQQRTRTLTTLDGDRTQKGEGKGREGEIHTRIYARC